MNTRIVKGSQGDLVVETIGRPGATPVIFLHSDCGVRDHWQCAADAVSRDRLAISYDRRGHGESAIPRNGDYSIDRSTEDVFAVADALGVERFILVGHSGGGALAFACAGKHPERIAMLMLVDPEPDPAALPPDLLKSQLAALETDFEKTLREYYASQTGSNPAVTERVLRDALATSKQTAIGTLQAFIEFKPRSYAGKFRGPALSIIQSQFDSPHALHRIGGFPHASIDGVGHWLQLGAPDQFNCMLLDFIAHVETESREHRRVG